MPVLLEDSCPIGTTINGRSTPTGGYVWTADAGLAFGNTSNTGWTWSVGSALPKSHKLTISQTHNGSESSNFYIYSGLVALERDKPAFTAATNRITYLGTGGGTLGTWTGDWTTLVLEVAGTAVKAWFDGTLRVDTTRGDLAGDATPGTVMSPWSKRTSVTYIKVEGDLPGAPFLPARPVQAAQSAM